MRFAEGGWRVLTSMRSIADLLASRSCDEGHWHRPVERGFPAAASLPQLCCRLMPTIRRRPTPMELTELIAGATVRRRLRGKQSTPRRLTRKQPQPNGNRPQSAETVPAMEELPIMPTETEPWRPLTETEKTAWDALSTEERAVCDALVHRLHRELGHSAHQRHGGQSSPKSCCQTHAVHNWMSRPVSSGKIMEPGVVLQMDNFNWKHPTKEVHVKGTLLVDASSRAAVVRIWRTASRQELLGNVSPLEARQMLQESWFKFYGRPETVKS